MSQETNDNDVLSWLERRKKKKLKYEDHSKPILQSNELNALHINSDKTSNDFENSQRNKTHSTNCNSEDDEAYGCTQMLSSQPKSSKPVNCNQIKPSSESRPVTSVPPIKKPKFGLPGIAPMPPKSESSSNGSNRQEHPFNCSKEIMTKEKIKPKFGLPSLMNKSQSFPDGKEKMLSVAAPMTSLKHSYSSENIVPEVNRNFGVNHNDVQAEIKLPSFKTAHEQLVIDNQKRFGKNSRINQVNPQLASGYGTNNARSLGISKITNNFKPPINNCNLEDKGGTLLAKSPSDTSSKLSLPEEPPLGDERLRGIDTKMVETIQNEILFNGKPTDWNDIAGLDFVKKTVKEIVVFPLLRPDIFTGLRSPPKGILLFGPPGTGKTLIGRCIASKSNSTFFNISASSLTSKWIGDGEKMVRALFAVARVYQPSVVFIDEIDSLLSSRSDSEHESSRRLKTEFLVQLDGASSTGEERILIVGATNRPQDLDEAARRRLVKRLYVPLPNEIARKQIIDNLLQVQGTHCLTDDDMTAIAKKTEGYSGADMAELCKESAMGPIRSIDYSQIENIDVENVRDITIQDFLDALSNVKPSVSDKDITMYLEWNTTFGSGSSGS